MSEALKVETKVVEQLPSSEKNVVEHIDDKNTASVHEIDEKDGVVHRELDQFGAWAKSDPKEIALVRKLDLYIMPILWFMYFLNFLDRNAMINGKLNKLDKDLGMKGQQYNTCVSIFFVGYLTGQVPSNMILNRVRPSLFMAACMFAWAIVSTLTYLVKDYKGMMIARFVLGVTEAPFYPGALYMISQFYTRKECATRYAVFYSGNMMASSFSGLIAAGVFEGLHGVRGLAGWRWLFIIQGAITIAAAGVAYFMLPDSPMKTKWLTPEERQLAYDRMERDMTGRREPTSTWIGLGEACLDYRTWLFCLMQNMHLSANGFKNFLPSVIQTLKFSPTISLVLTCPPYLLATFTSIAVSWSSGHYNERTWHITASKSIAIAGFAIAWGSLNLGARYFAIVLFVGATYGVNNIGLAWVASSMGQTNEKKAVAIALANTLGNLSFVYTPFLWPDNDKPRYGMAMGASIGFSAGVILVAWILRVVLIRDNKKIRATDSEAVNFYAY